MGKSPLIKPEEIHISEFQGSMTDGRAKFLEWSEKVFDRVALYQDNMVDAMARAEKETEEFKERVIKKRQVIEDNEVKLRELSLKETMVICERCKQDLGELKQLKFEREDLHFARCVFGFYKKVSL